MTIDETWVEEALRPWAAGGRLVGVVERRGDAFNSDVRHLLLSWEDASPDAPAAVVWKRGLADNREVEIWRLLRSRRELPVPRCFAADDRGVLLEDLSASHGPAVSRDDLLAGRGVPPNDGAGRVVVRLRGGRLCKYRAARARQRHGRLDPVAGRLVRRRRRQTQLWTCI